MAEAVRAVAEIKFGPAGIFRSPSTGSCWSKHGETIEQVPAVSEAAIQATISYCEYLFERYGRFPVYLTPYRTVLGFQACHLDADFYNKFYRPEALEKSQRADCNRARVPT